MIFKSTIMPKIRLLSHSPKHHAHTNSKFKTNNKWQRFYGSTAWRNLREAKLLEQPLCEECLLHDKITPATQVHHKVPFGLGIDDKQKWELFLDWDNLESICTECHRRIHGNRENS